MNRTDIIRLVRKEKISANEVKQVTNALHLTYTNKDAALVSIKKFLCIPHKNKCIFEGCKNGAKYCYEDKIKLFCEEHHVEDTTLIKSDVEYYKRIELIEKLRDGKIEEVAKELGIKNLAHGVLVRTIKVKLNDINIQYCIEEFCKNKCSFGNKGHVSLFCEQHYLPNMVKTMGKIKMCDVEYCQQIFKFRSEDNSVRRCLDHKSETMIKVSTACKYENCTITAHFGYKTDGIKMYCNAHKKIDMVNIVIKLCKEKGCKTSPGFGFLGGKREYCFIHMKNGMISLKKQCEKCSRRAYFGLISEIAPRWCQDHKPEGATTSHRKPCEHEGCVTGAYWKVEDGDGKKYCAQHKPENAINSAYKRCNINGCKLDAVYGYKNSERVLCTKHRLKDMVNHKRRCCTFPTCDERASFGTVTEKIAIYCGKHKSSDMIALHKKSCKFESCTLRPYYGFRKDNKMQYCILHKLPGMLNLKSNRCEKCDTCSCYGFETDNIPRYCANHAIEGTVSVLRRICEIENCKQFAGFGFYHSPPIRCLEHKDIDHIGQKLSRPKCYECGNKAIYGRGNPTFCNEHKHENDRLIVKISICTCCFLKIPMNSTESDICEECYVFANTTDHRHKKENKIGKLLNNLEVNLISHDRVVESGCNKYRPDYVIDNNYNFLIIEVDENQHKDKSYNCEINRMKEITNCFGSTPVIFIRFNPDSYSVGNRIIESYYGREKILNDLLQTLKNNSNNISDLLSVYYLFYNEFTTPERKVISMEYEPVLSNN